ncbi:MAG TPA: adenylate/guanylate cyclase domain-containing protein [Gaiellaceae bacterium]
MTVCSSCGAENRADAKFCGECGAPLAVLCALCGTSNEPGRKFCFECGAALGRAAPAAEPREAPVAERRLVSVLFVDLVGFTSLSENRDAEEVRELLSRYFDTCRRLIELYGGTVEKFIGDAVMAVWGTPTATEDDAERAVRAALDLVVAVSALGQEVGAEELRARAGVLTGEAAVTLGAEGQGMVAGDLVNTASRVQSVAEGGTVFVGESTRRATEQTIVYADAGSFELKGKEGLTPLWRAQRVVSGLRGSLKSQGLEAPFVGRDRELRQIKDLFHACAEEKKPHLVSVTGIAGIGKSRLGWEFYKYFDGIAESVYWHRGRCLSYGEGVTYWALADMVRMRCRIAEEEDPASALSKLRATLEEQILEAEERAFLEPRLAHLLGLGDHQARDQQDLFGAWRLFFERLADGYPVVLLFEDMQWADASLLDFVEYLLDWSRNSPIFVITLARPELLERRPTWGAGQRSFTSLYLEPLSQPAMEELLTGLVPGLPPDACGRILVRAEGIPLYAVETVRMLLDRGLVVQDGSAYRLAGPVDELEVPETLHALIAARLDGLSADERRVLQDASVLGKTFTKTALASLAGTEAEIEPLLASLVRKEVLGVQADPRSPEHGQYGFLQDLVRHVAYETLSRRERRARHLAAAAYLRSAFAEDEDEAVEVVASHYLAAFEAMPDADDAGEIRANAQAMLARAGEHAASLAAASEARRYFEQAAGLTDELVDRAALLARAGEMAVLAADVDAAGGLYEQSIDLYEQLGEVHAAARVNHELARVESMTGRREDAIARAERALEVLVQDEPDEDLAMVAGTLALAYWFSGDLERAGERVELALDVAEAHAYPEPLVRALRAKAGILRSRGHLEESTALLARSLELALEHDVLPEISTTYFWLSDRCFQRDAYAEALGLLDQALAHARRMGSRPNEWAVLAERTYPLLMLGRWDEAYAAASEFTQEQVDTGGTMLSLLQSAVEIDVQRGDLEGARRMLQMFSRLEHSPDRQEFGALLGTRAALRRAEGRLDEALAGAEQAVDVASMFGIDSQIGKQGVCEALEAAFALGDTGKVEQLIGSIDTIPPGTRPPYLDAMARRFRAKLVADPQGLGTATARFRELELPFQVAVTLLEHAELGRSSESEPLLAEATEIFERLGATPWIERARRSASADALVS